MTEYRKKLKEEINEYLIDDLSNIVLEYCIDEYTGKKYEIFDKIWSLIKHHREIINDNSKIQECMKIEKEFDKTIPYFFKKGNNLEGFTYKRYKRNSEYIFKLAIKEKMYKNLNPSFKNDINGMIKCGKCGRLKNICDMQKVFKPKYNYVCYYRCNKYDINDGYRKILFNRAI
jgi:hypothetical protein